MTWPPSTAPTDRSPAPASRRGESGDRRAFLDRLSQRAARPVPTNLAHPPPDPDPRAPQIGYRLLDEGRSLVDVFETVATDQSARVHRTAATVPPSRVLRRIINDHGVQRAVATEEPIAQATASVLAGLGVDVRAAEPAEAAGADLGVTECRAAIAATGSVVLDVDANRSRSASLLPPVHLCILDACALVGSPGEVLRPLSRASRLPSSLVLVSGPSRTGDIEQLMTLGVHGPVAVHVVVTNLSG